MEVYEKRGFHYEKRVSSWDGKTVLNEGREFGKKRKKDDLWKQCWSLNVPNAVKMYLWKACHNLLPTKANLFRRGVHDTSQCLICLRAEETVVHVAWACPTASDAWGESRIRLQKSVSGEYDFAQVFMDVVSRCEKEEVQLFGVLSRHLWLRRNDYVHEGNLTHPSQVVRDAKTALVEFQRVNNVGAAGTRSHHT